MAPTYFGRYEIVKQLGKGGMATVYHAIDPRFERDVAIKVMPHEFLHDDTFQERFKREAKTIANLDHPAITAVYDFGEHEGQPYLVMRYMAGGALAEHIARQPLTIDQTINIFERLAEALDWAHSKGIVHRDIKPANVLFDQHGYAYLADFGIVKLTESTVQLTGAGVVGTPAYMAPEMADAGSTSPLIDIYALGVTLFQTLTGNLPYESDTPMGVLMAHISKPVPDIFNYRHDLPSGTQHVIERAMAKNPHDRYQTAGDMVADLKTAATGEAVTPPPAAPVEEADFKTIEEPITVQAPKVAEATIPEAADFDQQTLEVPSLDSDEPTAIPSPTPEPKHVPEPVIDAPSAERTGPNWMLIGGGIVGVVLLAAIIIGAITLFGGKGDDEVAEEEATEEPADTGGDEEDTVADIDVDAVKELARAGVGSNDEWTPYIEEINGVEMVLVPAGCFQMGSDESNVGDERPLHTVCLDQPYWLDLYEVTNGLYGEASSECIEVSSEDGQPRVCVNWYEAMEHCQSRGARLPTEAEWEFAARGPDNLKYPWGDTLRDTYPVWSGDGSAESIRRGVEPVGSKPNAASWVGALDMSGNVWEWTYDWFAPYPTDRQYNPMGPDNGEEKVVRGGSWQSSLIFNDVRGNSRNAHYTPNIALDSGGFRCMTPFEGEVEMVDIQPPPTSIPAFESGLCEPTLPYTVAFKPEAPEGYETVKTRGDEVVNVPADTPLFIDIGGWGANGADCAAQNAEHFTYTLLINGEEIPFMKSNVYECPDDIQADVENVYCVLFYALLDDGLPAGNYEVIRRGSTDEPITDGYDWNGDGEPDFVSVEDAFEWFYQFIVQ